MSTVRPGQHEEKTQSDGSNAVRWRLWVAMLALALVPTIAAAYLITSLLSEPDATLAAGRSRESSASAAALLAREQAIGERLQIVAADPQVARLANGIESNSDRQLATRVLKSLRGEDGAIVASACVVRVADGQSVPLSSARTGACADGSLPRRAIAMSDSITRTTSGEGAAQRLLIATPLRSDAGQVSAVLSAEVDVAKLFDRTRMLGGDTVSSMLVDMGSSEVVATAAASVGPVDGADPVDPAAVAPYLSGVVSHTDDADADLRAMGLLSTVVPLWSNGDGTRMSLVQLWPDTSGGMPLGIRLALVIMLAGAIVAVIVLVRYFLNPFRELATSRDELQTLYREAREVALADGLTGLGNHRAFQEELGRQIRIFEERGTPFSLALMDLDDLKVVNDREGHAAGDEMLVKMARTMRDLARFEDRLYRTGGDEFAMILPNTEPDDAISVALRILHFCKRPPGGGRPSAFSSGVSGVPRFSRQRDLVYRQADAALYWAKRNQRGSVELFEPDRDKISDEATDATAQAVAEVITGKLLRPVFQPIVDLRSGRILGFEGLIRPDPHGPLPDTGRLFTAAAASGRTVDLDLACLEMVVDAASAIGSDRLLTLNLSPRTLETKDFDAAWLLSGLVRNGISPSRVIIELTEREEVEDLGRLQQTFNLLQQYGLRLAADDVGAGNSGLRLLSQVHFDIVKIDLALVQSGVNRESARAVLQSLRDLAVSQNSRMIAEGVETARQLRAIREMDIGAAQGFLLGRPDASVAMTFVDVRQLETGIVVPDAAHPVATLLPAGAIDDAAMDDISDERRAIFLPPAAGLESSAGAI